MLSGVSSINTYQLLITANPYVSDSEECTEHTLLAKVDLQPGRRDRIHI